MRNSTASVGLSLPFGTLTGIIPVDAIPRGRVLGDFSSVLGGHNRIADSPETPFVARSNPACTASPPSRCMEWDGGI